MKIIRIIKFITSLKFGGSCELFAIEECNNFFDSAIVSGSSHKTDANNISGRNNLNKLKTKNIT